MLNFMIYFAIISSIITIVAAFVIKSSVAKKPAGDAKMQEISKAIEEGSRAYLKRQYKTVAVVAIILAVVLAIFFGVTTAVGFVIGGVASPSPATSA